MPAILTVTFSPCIDKSTSVPSLIPEKKMKCSEPKLEPGGGGINVARAIKKLGGEAMAIYPAGGYTGKFFIRLLAEEGVSSVVIASGNETRENIIVLEESNNRQYRFGMPGTALNENEWQQILKMVEETGNPEYIVASGSLPPGVPPDIFARLAVIARKKNARLVADTSGKPLKYAADKGVYLLKPNLGELASLVGKDHLEPEDIPEAAKQIIEKKECEVIVVSRGAAGATLVTKDIVKNITPPEVEQKSTVGAGDSMVAGIILALSKGKSLETAVQYGVACGTAATLNPGTELCSREDADELFKRIVSQQT